MDNSSALSSGNFYSSEIQDCLFGSLRIIWVRNAGYELAETLPGAWGQTEFQVNLKLGLTPRGCVS